MGEALTNDMLTNIRGLLDWHKGSDPDGVDDLLFQIEDLLRDADDYGYELTFRQKQSA
jgi:hypothetical protein